VSEPDTLLTPDDVRAIYREFLERAPGEVEVEVQMAACRTTHELLDVVRASEEYEVRLRARGEAAVVERPRANIWHPDLDAWTHPPGTVSADGIAVVGRHGWLFIRSGTNSTLVQHRGEDPPSAAWLDAWMEGLAVRRREAAQIGVSLACVVVPDKLAIHEEHFPEAIEPIGSRPALRLRKRAGSALLYPLDELRAARARHPQQPADRAALVIDRDVDGAEQVCPGRPRHWARSTLQSAVPSQGQLPPEERVVMPGVSCRLCEHAADSVLRARRATR